MTKLKRQTVVNKDPETCFDFIADPEKAPLFVSSLHSITPVSTEPRGKGNRWTWEYDLFGVPIRGDSECVVFNRPNQYSWKSTTTIPSTWTYTLTPTNEGTEITMEIEYEVPDSVLTGKVADKLVVEKLNQNEADNAIKNLKTILEM